MRDIRQSGAEGKCGNGTTSTVWSTAELLMEELRAATTARAALLATMGRVISIRRDEGAAALLHGQPYSLSLCSGVVEDEARQARSAVEETVVDILKNAVHEGELPEGTEVAVLGSLCMSALMGFGLSALDGRSGHQLAAATQMLVNGLGFHPELSARRRARRSPPDAGMTKQKASA